jgi:hypothetical protein
MVMYSTLSLNGAETAIKINLLELHFFAAFFYLKEGICMVISHVIQAKIRACKWRK